MKTRLGIEFWEDEDVEIDIDVDEDPLGPLTLAEIRRFFGVTQAEFAEMVGATTRTVKAWERRKRDSESRNCTGPARKFILHLVAEKISES